MTLRDKLIAYDLNFDDKFYDRINNYIALLKQWGRVHNLTAKLDDDSIEKNIIDSVYPFSIISKYKNIADIGTGAGFPGLIIAIACPDISVTLFEPRNKRAAFLSFVKNFLNLHGVKVIDKRVEEVNEQIVYDLVISRAVTNTSMLMDITKDIVDNNTSYLFYKGSMVPSELKEARINEYEIINHYDRNYLYINNKGK